MVQIWAPASTLLWILCLCLCLIGLVTSSVIALTMSQYVACHSGQLASTLKSKALSQCQPSTWHVEALGLSTDLNQVCSMILIMQMTGTLGVGTGCIPEQVQKWLASRRHLCVSTFQALRQSPQAKGLKNYNIYSSLAINSLQSA